MAHMTKEESYAERRLLFKNIWETAMQIDDKDDILSKPKVIKTLRLDDMDRCVVGKGKKEKIKNLRTVCNRILDFCNKQDADDKFYKQMTVGNGLTRRNKTYYQSKKLKSHRGRKKTKKTTLLVPPATGDQSSGNATTSERRNDFFQEITRLPRSPSPNEMKRTVIVRRTAVKHRTAKVKSNPNTMEANNALAKISVTRPKLVRKRRSKRKKASMRNVSPRPTGASNNARYVSAPLTGRAVLRRIRHLLTVRKFVVTS